MKRVYPDKEPKFTLKKLITDAGLTQRELSRRSGIKETTINSWVAGKRMPTFDNAVVLAREIGVDLKTLADSLGIDVSGIPDD